MPETTDPALSAVRRALSNVTKAEQRLIDTVAAARAAGTSWAQIGAIAGVTRQAAWERFHDRVEGGA